MGLLNWLFGKKENPSAAPVEERSPPLLKTESVKPAAEAERSGLDGSEAENLRRWRMSGQARAWVEQRQGNWGHSDWLTLLEELKRSSFWPMRLEAIGQALEDAKREWLRRN